MNEESISESPKPGHHIIPIEVTPRNWCSGCPVSAQSLEKNEIKYVMSLASIDKYFCEL